MTNQQGAPEALRLALELDAVPETGADPQMLQDAAVELRRLHAENERLAALVEAQQPAPSAATMSPINRLIAYSAAATLRSLGYQWDEDTEAWKLAPSPTPQTASQPAHQWDVGYPPLPVQLSFDALAYAPGCAYSEAQMRAYVDADRAARATADSVTAPAGGVDDAVDAIALARYKVVPAHESMFHRFAVLAGDGKRQLYLGREIECANMARKFAGAFLDGAFYQANIAPTPPAQAADSVLEDAARLDWLDQQCEVYGFQDIHEGIRWGISGPYANVRQAIDYERASRKQGEKQ